MTRPNESRAEYDPQVVEARWQERWRQRRTNAVDLAGAARPYYSLMMFPYPSAEGLHVGNVFAFVGNDLHARFRRLQGHDVFEPIGFDAFGIHSENYALKVNTHPAELIPRNIIRFREQIRRVGFMVDWDHELSTTDPRYYKWTQWIFVQLFRAGLAYRKAAPVNWCPECKTVLANEQVIAGYCERHPGTAVTQRVLEQWFFAITRYAQRLLEHLDWLDWSDSTRTAQRNWIGRSEGAELSFRTPVGDDIRVFTTRPDTVFGATYVVLAPEHPLVDQITAAERRPDVKAYLRRTQAMDIVSRRVGSKEKSGVFTGAYARNPATGESVPVWIADYVLMEYGTGAIMAVPAHDERDYEFATAFGLPIRPVVEPAGSGERGAVPSDAPLEPVTAGRSPGREAGTEGTALRSPLPYTGWDGRLINSGRFNGLDCRAAVREITGWLEGKGLGAAQTTYRLHDWCISRQRYWGPPIPIIYCDTCGPVPVPERDLPVLLPPLADYRPDESGVSPLARNTEWYRVPCPECGRPARRETDVSDTFLDSSWYFLRYPSTGDDDRPFDPGLTKKWLPVNSYIGGNEHAVLHLLYSRFITMVLHDLGHLGFEEPYRRFRAHGTIVKDGAKMSKSRGNVVVPDEYIAHWGADTFRMYLMFLGPYLEGGDFRDEGIAGIRRFLDKVWGLVADVPDGAEGQGGSGTAKEAARRKLHQTIRKVGDDLEALEYHTAIAAMMEYVNVLRKEGQEGRGAVGQQKIGKDLVEPLVILLAPFAPHFAEECWERLGHKTSVFEARWPAFDPELARDPEIELVVQVNGKVRGRIRVPAGLPEAEAVSRARAEPSVAKFLNGNDIRKVVFVPDRLVNLVV
ncbi:MAG TPA: leucine--tRNA ligase [Gemmatimonadales bacterium]|nr:leucine--tRNA ligase [Gemmatimonadales bacterium]